MMMRKSIPPNCYEQIRDAYKRMAKRTQYRPAAPSDGMGNITVPEAQLDLEDEASRYAREWWACEDDLRFFIGCCDYVTRPATIFAIEAARLMCAGGDCGEPALKLLKMAVSELEKLAREEAERDRRERDRIASLLTVTGLPF